LGIFSWLFSKNTENNSQVRKWVAEEIKMVDILSPDTYAIFVAIIQAAVQWGKYSTREQEDELLEVSKHYLGDATIFEIACYTYYRLEEWLNKNQPAFTVAITIPVSKLIVEKFYTSLYLEQEQVNRVFQEQLAAYKTMAGAGKNIVEIQLALEEQIMMTKDDKFNNKQLSVERSSLVLDSQYIKRSLDEYEEVMGTTVIASVKEYCSQNAKQQVSPSQQQKKGELQGQQDYIFAMALVAQQDWHRACKVLTKVIADNPEHYDALVQRGLCYAALQQAVDAEQDFTRAIAINPEKSDAYLHRGKCNHRGFRQREKALADYCEAIRLAPGSAAGYFGRGELYDDIALCDEKIAQEKNDQTAYAAVSPEFLAAIDDYSKVIALEPEYDAAYVNRALLYTRKARATHNAQFISNAIADFEKAMQLERTNGYLYKQQDDMQELLDQINATAGQA